MRKLPKIARKQRDVKGQLLPFKKRVGQAQWLRRAERLALENGDKHAS